MVITPDSIFISNANACIYTKYMAVGFHLPLSLFGFLSNQIPINYLFTIILKDYSNKNEGVKLAYRGKSQVNVSMLQKVDLSLNEGVYKCRN